MRLQNILVATDFSRAAEPVYRWAIALARRFDSRVTVLNVDETGGFEWPARTMQGAVRLKEFLEDLSRHRSALLAEARDRFESEAIAVVTKAVVGRASDRILEHARSAEVDLVVIGRLGTRGGGRLKLGSTTKRVLRRVEVPTLVVPGAPESGDPPEPFGGQRVLSATAFSAACMMTIDAALELADDLDSHVDCVHVIRLPVPFSITPAEWPQIVPGETREELEHLHARDLADHVGEERAERCTPYTTLGVSVSESLRDLALESGADLITIPSHSDGREHPPRFGSTAERVIKRSPVPVLVFPVRYLERHFGLAS